MSAAKSAQIAHKVLDVDDDPDIVELLEYNLEKEGYEVATAANGKMAIETARSFIPELVVLDIMMPQMDGISKPPANCEQSPILEIPTSYF